MSGVQGFSVEEVVTLTQEFQRRNYIEGLLLSSGIIRSLALDDLLAGLIDGILHPIPDGAELLQEGMRPFHRGSLTGSGP